MFKTSIKHWEQLKNTKGNQKICLWIRRFNVGNMSGPLKHAIDLMQSHSKAQHSFYGIDKNGFKVYILKSKK